MIVLRNLPAEVLENLAKIGKSRLSDFGREAGGSGESPTVVTEHGPRY